jgi:hypothetical protein
MCSTYLGGVGWYGMGSGEGEGEVSRRPPPWGAPAEEKHDGIPALPYDWVHHRRLNGSTGRLNIA